MTPARSALPKPVTVTEKPILPSAAPADDDPQPVMTYEISPYKSSSESSDEDDDEYRRPKKPIPEWAQTANLWGTLQGQKHVDPDEIFKQKHIKTCNLGDMFGDASKPKYSRPRGSSGNWVQDRVTWQEELAYKKAMGFRAFA